MTLYHIVLYDSIIHRAPYHSSCTLSHCWIVCVIQMIWNYVLIKIIINLNWYLVCSFVKKKFLSNSEFKCIQYTIQKVTWQVICSANMFGKHVCSSSFWWLFQFELSRSMLKWTVSLKIHFFIISRLNATEELDSSVHSTINMKIN